MRAAGFAPTHHREAGAARTGPHPPRWSVAPRTRPRALRVGVGVGWRWRWSWSAWRQTRTPFLPSPDSAVSPENVYGDVRRCTRPGSRCRRSPRSARRRGGGGLAGGGAGGRVPHGAADVGRGVLGRGGRGCRRWTRSAPSSDLPLTITVATATTAAGVAVAGELVACGSVAAGGLAPGRSRCSGRTSIRRPPAGPRRRRAPPGGRSPGWARTPTWASGTGVSAGVAYLHWSPRRISASVRIIPMPITRGLCGPVHPRLNRPAPARAGGVQPGAEASPRAATGVDPGEALVGALWDEHGDALLGYVAPGFSVSEGRGHPGGDAPRLAQRQPLDTASDRLRPWLLAGRGPPGHRPAPGPAEPAEVLGSPKLESPR